MAIYPNPVGYFTTSEHAERLCDRFGDYTLPQLSDHDKSLLVAALSTLRHLRRLDGEASLIGTARELLEDGEAFSVDISEAMLILNSIPTHHIQPLLQFMLQ